MREGSRVRTPPRTQNEPDPNRLVVCPLSECKIAFYKRDMRYVHMARVHSSKTMTSGGQRTCTLRPLHTKHTCTIRFIRSAAQHTNIHILQRENVRVHSMESLRTVCIHNIDHIEEEQRCVVLN